MKLLALALFVGVFSFATLPAAHATTVGADVSMHAEASSWLCGFVNVAGTAGGLMEVKAATEDDAKAAAQAQLPDDFHVTACVVAG